MKMDPNLFADTILAILDKHLDPQVHVAAVTALANYSRPGVAETLTVDGVNAKVVITDAAIEWGAVAGNRIDDRRRRA